MQEWLWCAHTPGRRTRGKAGHHTEWWDRPRHRYELVTSEVVLVEAGSGDTSVAGQQLLAMQGIRVLADSPEVDFIATELIRRRLLPSKARLDAVHIAFAAVYQVDFLATWVSAHQHHPPHGENRGYPGGLIASSRADVGLA